LRWKNKWKSPGAKSGLYGGCEFPSEDHILRWEIVRWNAPRIWRDFGSALSFQTRLTQTKPVLPLSNEHGSQIKDRGRRQCCHNKHKHFPYRPTRDVSFLSGHASCIITLQFPSRPVYKEISDFTFQYKLSAPKLHFQCFFFPATDFF
jgi:hypothetical protein